MSNRKKRTTIVELLEPRLLFSADVFAGALDAHAVNSPVLDIFEQSNLPPLTNLTPPTASDSTVDDTIAPVQDTAPTPHAAHAGTSLEVIFVDTNTPEHQALLDQLLIGDTNNRQFDIVLIEHSDDGLDVISESLSQYQNLDAIHIISHGSPGELQLGTAALNNDTILVDGDAISEWSKAFSTDGDILIYGCDFASSDDGKALVDTLSRITQTDVAASTDATGAIKLGGNWRFEYDNGEVSTNIAFSDDLKSAWQHTLATITITTTSDELDGDTTTIASDVVAINDAPTINSDNESLLTLFNDSRILTTVGKVNAYADNMIAVDTSQTYDLNLTASSGDGAGGSFDASSRNYVGIKSYDIDGIAIIGINIGKYVGSTDTTLAADLKPGDTQIVLTDATGWSNATSGYNNSIAWYGYTNSQGDTYEDYTYTQYTATSLWSAGAISGNVITLDSAWTGEEISTGTAIRNATNPAGTHQYPILSHQAIPETSTAYSVTIGGGVNQNGTDSYSLFRSGTAYIQPLVLADYGDKGTQINVENFTVTPSGAILEYTENSAISIIDSSFSFNDVDDNYAEGVTVTLENGKIGDTFNADTAAINALGISITGVPSTGLTADGSITLTLTSDTAESVTFADYVTALETITFESTSDDFNSSNRIITLNVDDGDAESADYTVVVSMVNVNDAPVINSNDDPILFEFDGSPTVTTVGKANNYADNRIDIDTNLEYEITATAFAGDGAGGNYSESSINYIGIRSFDSDNNAIYGYHVGKNPDSTDTTLAVDLKPGDTEIVLTDATGWNNTRSGSFATLAWYGYTNSDGYTYDDYTYTRNVLTGAWSPGGISGNTITLDTAWAGPELTAGSAVRNTQNVSGTNQYLVLLRENIPETETTFSATIGNGVSTDGSDDESLFRPGTVSIQALAFADYNDTGTQTTFSDFTIAQKTELKEYTENDSAISIIGNSSTISDADDDYAEGITVTLTNGKIGDLLNVDTAAINALGISITGVPTDSLSTNTSINLTLTSDAADSVTFADYKTALEAITFENTLEDFDTSNRTIKIAVTDGELLSDEHVVLIRMISVDDAPVLTTTADYSVPSRDVVVFEGDDNSIILSDLPVNTAEGTEVTVEFWLDWDSSTSGEMVFGFDRYDLYFASGNFGFNTGNGDIFGFDADEVSDGWHHIAAVFNNGDISQNRIMVDGVEHTVSQMAGTPLTTYTYATSDARISGWNTTTSYRLTGAMDEVRIWNGARTATEISDNMNLSLSSSETNLVASYSFTGATTGTDGVLDDSGNGNHGTMVGITEANIRNADKLTWTPQTTTYTENDAATALNATIELVDEDDADLEGAVISISDGYETASDILGFVDQNGITGVYANGTLTLTGTATVAQYQTALRSITFENTSDDPSTAQRTIDWSVTDGTVTSVVENSYVDIEAVNDAPLLRSNDSVLFEGDNNSIRLSDLEVNTASGTEVTVEFWMNWDGTHFVMPFGFDDYDLFLWSGYFGFNSGASDLYGINSAGLENGWHHVAAVFNNGDVTSNRLLIDGVEQVLTQKLGTPSSTKSFATSDAIISGWNTAGGYAINGSIDELRIWNGARTQTEISDSMYLSLSGEQTNLVASYNFSDATTGTDGVLDSSGNDNHGTMSNITETNIQNASWATWVPTKITYTENDAATALNATIELVDEDDADLEGAVISISDGYETASDILGFVDQNGITGVYANGTLTLTGTATVAQYQTALRSITFENTSDDPSTAQRTIDWSVTDGTVTSVVENSYVDIERVNDAPVLNSNASILFEGGDDTIVLSDLPVNTASGTDVTVEFWMDWDGTNVVMPFGFGKYDLHFTGSLFGFNSGNGDIFGINNTGLADGWHHIAAVFNNGDVASSRLVIDGVEQVLTQLASTPKNSAAFASTDAHISGWNKNDSYKFSGSIDELRIWNGARTLTEISDNMHLSLSGEQTNLVASYNFSDASTGADGVLDSSDNDNHGTMSGVTEANIQNASWDTWVPIKIAYTENDAATVLNATIELIDEDDNNLEGAVISISDGYETASDILGFVDQNGITGVYANGTLTLTGTATIAQYQTALRSITFENISDDPSTAQRTIDWSVTDGTVTSVVENSYVDIEAVNDAPQFLGPELVTNGTFDTNTSGWSTSASAKYHYSTGLYFGGGDTVGPHAASQALSTIAGETYRLTFDYRDGTVGLNQSLQVTVDGTSNLLTTSQIVTDKAGTTFVRYEYTFTADSSTSTLTFTDTSDTAGVSDTTVAVDGYLDNISLRQIDGTVSITEGDAATVLNSDVTLFDDEINGGLDDYTDTVLTIVRDSTASPDDVFSATGNLGTLVGGRDLVFSSTTIGTVVTNTNGTLSIQFNSSATEAMVNEVLQSIAYRNISDNPASSVQLNWTFIDGNDAGEQGTGGELTATGHTTVNITAVNDAPVVITDSGVDDPTNELINFEGDDDSIALTGLGVNTTADSGVTVEFWMHWDGSNNQMPFGFEKYNLWFLNGSFGFNSNHGDIYGITSAGLSGEWHHVAAVFHNGDVQQSRLIIDGVEQAMTQQLATPSKIPVYAGSDAQISGWTYTDLFKFDGQIDEVRIWNGARDISDIRENMHTSITGAQTDLVANYSFTDATTGTGGVIDNSGNGNHGTMEGMTAANVVTTSGFPEFASTLSYTENDAAAVINPDVTITDVDDTHLEGATIQITGGFQSGADVLAFTNQNGITGVYANGTLTLTGTATVAQYQTALRSITFENTSDDPSTTQRTIDWSVTDASATSNVENSYVEIEAVNDAPVIQINKSVLFEGGDDTIVLSDLAVNTASGTDVTVEFWMDWDGTNVVMPFGFEKYNMVFWFGYFGFNTGNSDLYGMDSSALANGWHHVAAVFNNGDATTNSLFIDGIEQSLSQIHKTPISSNSFATSDANISGWGNQDYNKFTGSIDELRIWNGARTQTEISDNMYLSLSGEQTNLVASYNFSDATTGTDGVLDSSGNNNHGTMSGITEDNIQNTSWDTSVPTKITYTENDASTALNATIELIDEDDTDLEGAVISISDGYETDADILGFVDQNGITGVYANGTLTLSGTATVAQYQAALRSIIFENTSDNPSTAQRTINWSASDAASTSIVENSYVDVVSSNDVPILVNTNLTITEGGQVYIDSTMISASDVDNSTDELTYTVSNAEGFRFQRIADPGSEITSFTQAEIDAGDIVARHLGADVAASFDLSVSDGEQSSATVAATISYTAVNDTPYIDTHGFSDEFTVNTTTDGAQAYPFIKAFSDDNYFVVWQDETAGKGQYFDSTGSPVGEEFTLTDTASASHISILTTSSDNTVVIWFDEDENIYARAFDSTGTALGASTILASSVQDHRLEVIELANGNFVAGYRSGAEPTFQMFDADLNQVGSATVVPDITTGAQSVPVLTATSFGFIYAFVDGSSRDGDSHGSFFQMYDADGTAIGSNIQINALTTEIQRVQDTIQLPNGNVVFTWLDTYVDGSDYAVMFRIFDDTGTAISGDISGSQTGAGRQDTPILNLLSDGSFTLTWGSRGANNFGEIFIRHFSADGTALTDELLVNTEAGKYGINPNTTVLSDDTIVIVWASGGDIVQRLFSFDDHITAYNEAETAVIAHDHLSLVDFDDTNLKEAVVQVTSNYVQGQDVLAMLDTTEITATWDATTGTLTLTGTATVEQYEAALRSVTYYNSYADIIDGERTLSWSVNDGNDDSFVQTSKIQVTKVNSAPSGSDNSTTITEDNDYVFTAADFGFSDVDGDQFAGINLVSLPSQGGLYVDDNNDGQIALSDMALVNMQITISDINNGNLKYKPGADENSTIYSSFYFTVFDDGDTDNGGINTSNSTYTYNFDVGAVADSPRGVVVHSNVVLIDDNFNDGDADGWSIPSGATADSGYINTGVTNNPTHHSVWNDTSALDWQDVTASVDLNFNDDDVMGISVHYQDEDNRVTAYINYQNNSTPKVQINSYVDGVNTTLASALLPDLYNREIVNLTIHAVGDTYTVEVDGATKLTANSADQLSGTIALYSSFQVGSFFDNVLVTTAQLTVVENASKNTVVGTTNGYDRDGDSLTYSLTDNAGGRFAINAITGEITVADGSLLNYESASSHDIIIRISDGSQTLDEAHTVYLANINDSPNGADKTITISEDNDYTLTTSDFGFSDADADELQGVIITTLPTQGGLYLDISGDGIFDDSEIVIINDKISATEITDGKLKFKPGGDENGIAYSSFSFNLVDDGGTTNGGIDTQVVSTTITFNVAAIDDAPVGLLVHSENSFLNDNFNHGDAYGWTLPTGFTGTGGNINSVTNNENAQYTVWNDSSALDWSDISASVDLNYGDNDRMGLAVRYQDSDNNVLAIVDYRNDAVGVLYLKYFVDGVEYSPKKISLPDIYNREDITLTVSAVGDYYSVEINGMLYVDTTITGLDSGTVALYTAFQTRSSFDNVIVNDSPANVNENASNAYVFATAQGFETDGDILTYSLTDNANGLFAIDEDSGEISVSDASLLDFESAISHDITIRISDGVNTLDEIHTIQVNDFSDAPAGADNTVTVLEDSEYSFSSDDFGFSDADGDTLTAVHFETLPTEGTLLYNNLAMTAGDSASKADIDSGLITYKPVDGAHGNAYASFTFTVSDNGGTTDGGLDRDQTENTITIDVTDAQTISGTVYEDVNGDSNLADAIAAANVQVYLYQDTDGDEEISAGDTLVDSTRTDSNGVYTFHSLLDSTYFVVVDSETIKSSAALNAEFEQAKTWAEQTYGVTGAANGTGFTTENGAIFGGKTADISDVASALATAEHVTKVTISGSDTSNINSAFSFNVVTGVNDSGQGSFRQFVQNANAISGANSMRFVPTSAANSNDDFGNAWWTIQLTGDLENITDVATTIDGTAYSKSNGTTVLNTNSGTIGTTGTVGLGDDGILGTADDVSKENYERPELEIVGYASDDYILYGSNDDFALTNFAVRKLSDGATNSTLVVMSGSDSSISDTLLGVSADGTAFDATGTNGAFIRLHESNSVSNNYFGYNGSNIITAISMHEADSSIITGNELNGGYQFGIAADGSDITVSENLVYGVTTGFGVGTFYGPYNGVTVENNTIRNTTGNTAISAGLGSSNTTIRYNIIDNNTNGIYVYSQVSETVSGAAASNAIISMNAISNIIDVGIDIYGVTSNDGELTSTFGNQAIDSPSMTSANLVGSTLTLEGYVGIAADDVDFANARVEFFESDGLGNGERYLGFLESDDNGNFAGSLSVSNLLNTDSIVATATLTGIGTSEFGSEYTINTSPNVTIPSSVTAIEDVATSISDISIDDTNINSVALSVISGTLTVETQGSASISSGSNGSTELTLTGTQPDINSTLATLEYLGNSNYNGSDTLSLTSTDTGGLVDFHSTYITITAVNDQPLATGNIVTASEDIALVIDASEFLYTDIENDSLTSVTLSDLMLNGGTLTHSAGAVFAVNGETLTAEQLADLTFTPAANDTTNSSFSYSVNDADSGTSKATMGITVTPVNDPPVAIADSFIVDEHRTTTLNLALNDIDVDDGLNLTNVIIASAPMYGTLSVNKDGTVDYVHNGSETTNDSFTYRITDLHGEQSNTVTVNLVINPVNDPPIALGNSLVTMEDTPLQLSVSDFIYSDSERDPLESVTISNLSLNGGALSNSAGKIAAVEGMRVTVAELSGFTFIPAANSNGEVSFDYTVNDSMEGVESATITILVNAINDTPIATNNTLTTQEDVSLIISPSDFIFTDIEDDSMKSVTFTDLMLFGGTLSHSSGSVVVSYGMTVELTDLADLTFTPELNNASDASFGYFVNDEAQGQIKGVMTIMVESENDAPEIISNGAQPNVSLIIQENETQVTTVSAVDRDDDDTIHYEISGGDDAYLFSIDELTGELSLFDPIDFENPNDANQDSQYEVVISALDSENSSDQQMITVSIEDVNERPTRIMLSTFNVNEHIDTENGYSIGTLTTVDQDFSDTTSYTIAGGLDEDLFSIGGIDENELILTAGILDYEQQSDYNVIIQTNDKGGLAHIESLTVIVENLNEAPIFTSLAPSNAVTEEIYTYYIATDNVDGDDITITASDLPQWLTLTDSGDGTALLTGYPTKTDTGEQKIQIIVSDGQNSSTQNFTLTVEKAANTATVQPVAPEVSTPEIAPVHLVVSEILDSLQSHFEHSEPVEKEIFSDHNDRRTTTQDDLTSEADSPAPLSGIDLTLLNADLVTGIFADDPETLRSEFLAQTRHSYLENLDLDNLKINPIDLRPADDYANASILDLRVQANDLEKFDSDLVDTDTEESKNQKLKENVIIGVSFTMTTGFIAWLLKRGFLLTALLVVSSAWKKHGVSRLFLSAEKKWFVAKNRKISEDDK